MKATYKSEGPPTPGHGQSFRAIRVTDIGQLPYSSILMFLSSTIFFMYPSGTNLLNKMFVKAKVMVKPSIRQI